MLAILFRPHCFLVCSSDPMIASLVARFIEPTWGPPGAEREDPGGPHVGHMILAVWDGNQ